MKKLARLLTVTLSILSLSLSAQTYQVDTKASKIAWRSLKVGGEHQGFVNIKSGWVKVEDGKLTGGEFIINMEKISVTDVEDEETQKEIIDHISNWKFFNVEKYKKAKFVITRYEDGMLYGELTIKGISKPVNFKADYSHGNGGFKSTSSAFSISREKWDLQLTNFIKNAAVKDPLYFKVKVVAKG